MTSFADDETAQKIAAAMKREGLQARAEMDTLIAAGYRAPSLLVGSAMQAARANIRLFFLAVALAHHTEMVKTKEQIAGDLIEEIPGLEEILDKVLGDD